MLSLIHQRNNRVVFFNFRNMHSNAAFYILVFYFFFQACSINNHQYFIFSFRYAASTITYQFKASLNDHPLIILQKEVLDLNGIAGLNIALYTKPSNFNIQWLNFSVKNKTSVKNIRVLTARHNSCPLNYAEIRVNIPVEILVYHIARGCVNFGLGICQTYPLEYFQFTRKYGMECFCQFL